MTIQVINVGTNPNDGTGDPARTAFQKVNANFALGTQDIASGTQALGTAAIASGGVSTLITTSAPGVLATDSVNWAFNSDPTGVAGYLPGAMLTIVVYPSTGGVNWKVVNNTANSITPGAITLNWQVTR